jgi:NADH:ubiquinone oxidoreductase subunit C
MKSARYLLDIIPTFISFFLIYNEGLYLSIKLSDLNKIVFFLNKHSLCSFKILGDYFCSDFLASSKRERFKFFINFLNVFSGIRLFINFLPLNVHPNSLFNIYKSVIWLEREIWDLYGVFFSKHPDLRRILTDYGFTGFPLRKDFPITGFVECRYNDFLKRIVFLDLSMTQEFRNMELLNPWLEA